MKLRKLWLVVALCVAYQANTESNEPKYAVTFNTLETAAFVGLNALLIGDVEPKLRYLPFHFDGSMKLNDSLGLSFGLVYRYEDYQDQGSLYSQNEGLRVKKVWTNYHEIFLLVGPRYSFSHTGLLGFYGAIKAGAGLAISPVYHNISVLAQPEIGYAFSFGRLFRLDLGLGVLANVPVYESLDFAVPWKASRIGYSFLGVIVHEFIPIFNVGVGLNW